MGEWASASEHQRYLEPTPEGTYDRCLCGCGGPTTHVGMANGLGLIAGCELSVRRWVRG